jgi:hypothetical protein
MICSAVWRIHCMVKSLAPARQIRTRREADGLSLDFRVLWVPGYPASAAATSAILAACSELPQFPADLEGLTGMLLVEQKDPSGDQHQSEHGDGRPGTGRPSHSHRPADWFCSAPPGRPAFVPVHRWMVWARLAFHSDEAARRRCRPTHSHEELVMAQQAIGRRFTPAERHQGLSSPS